jgi:peptidoglycan/LPS O-acetylase OafA/YrhL
VERGRIASLDGVRAVAICCVLFGHTYAAMPASWRLPVWVPLPYGGFGVQVFFVLSGFLITTLLAAERARTGRVRLRAFYRRRAYRILPPYGVMLAVATLLSALGVVSITRGALVSAAVFGWNYSPAASGWWLGHTWSLAIEEQFYLLWPLAFVLLGLRRGRVALVSFAVAAPAIRLVTWYEWPVLRGQVPAMFHTRGDALAVGCLLALAWPDPRTHLLLDRLVARRVHLVALAYLPLSWVLTRVWKAGWLTGAGFTLDAVAIALLVAYVVVHPPRWLTSRAVVHVGLVSYSLYLWQQWFLKPGELPVPLGLVCAFAAAEVSWRLVERPALALRQRREQPVAVGGAVVDVGADPDRVTADADVDALRRKGVREPVG